MKTVFLLIGGALLVLLQMSFKPAETTYPKVYFKDQVLENEKYKVSLTDIVGLEGELKVKVTVENLSDDYLMYKPTESSLMANGQKITASEKYLMISPRSKSFRVLNFKGKQMNLLKEFNFNLLGLYIMNANGPDVDFSTFKLPASVNDVNEKDILLSLTNVKKESIETQAKFKVTYNGNDALYMSPSMVSVTMPDGTTYANEFRNEKPSILLKGESDNIKCYWQRMPGGSANDMQMVEMKLNFSKTFKIIKPFILGAQEGTVVLDEALTKEKNN